MKRRFWALATAAFVALVATTAMVSSINGSAYPWRGG